MVFSSKNDLKFGNIVINPSLPVWKESYYEAPVDGLYVFELNLNIRTYTKNRQYRINVTIDGVSVDFIQDNSAPMESSTSDDPGITNHHRLVHQLKAGQKLAFNDSKQVKNFIRDYKTYKCYSNGKSHSCSWLSGRLLKRL